MNPLGFHPRPFTLMVSTLLLAAPVTISCAPDDGVDDVTPNAVITDPLTGLWDTIGSAAPIRSITRRSDGKLIGPISTGHSIQVRISGDGGATWSPHGSVATNSSVDFGDPTMLRIPGTRALFCAFREFTNAQWRVTVTRSDNDGDGWVYDSTVDRRAARRRPPHARHRGRRAIPESDRNYTPGLFVRAPNDVIVTIDQLGADRVMHRP